MVKVYKAKNNSFPVIDKMRTGKTLRLLMKWNAITPTDIMKYLNLTCVQTVYRWLNGQNIPSVDHLYALSQLFSMRMDNLLAGSRIDIDRFENRLTFYYKLMDGKAD